MLIRIGIARYILDGDETDVSCAIERTCERLTSRLVPTARQHADDFRQRYCYSEVVCEVLARHKKSLRALFDVYADMQGLKTVATRTMSYDDWLLLLKHLCFFDEAFQQREGVLCFVFSRLRVVDEESERGKRRLNSLSFEDFLEAVVRVATMKALPTNAELAILGARDAGTFLIQLRANPAGYTAFVKARERGWEDPLRQPIRRCVEHLLSLIIRTIETGLSESAGDMVLKRSELVRFHSQDGAIKTGGVSVAPVGKMGPAAVGSAEMLEEGVDGGFSFANLMSGMSAAPPPRASSSAAAGGPRGLGDGMSAISKGMATKLRGRWGAAAKHTAGEGEGGMGPSPQGAQPPGSSRGGAPPPLNLGSKLGSILKDTAGLQGPARQQRKRVDINTALQRVMELASELEDDAHEDRGAGQPMGAPVPPAGIAPVQASPRLRQLFGRAALAELQSSEN